jgi:hypothetical protein
MSYAEIVFVGTERIEVPEHHTSAIDKIRYATAIMKFRYPGAELQSIEIMNDEDANRTGSNGVGASESSQAA